MLSVGAVPGAARRFGIEFALHTRGKASGLSRNQSARVTSALRKKCSMTAMISGPMQVIFATVLPPLSVFCAVGLRSQFWLNLVFTLLGYVPGVVHAFHVLLSADPERGP
jgi:uncharacterized membrane protein YqaE (UPF0057 family)